MSNSQFVCGHPGCGLPVHGWSTGWKHSLGGRTGAIPPRRAHKPVPVLRTDYDRLADPYTPPTESRELAARFRELDRQINERNPS